MNCRKVGKGFERKERLEVRQFARTEGEGSFFFKVVMVSYFKGNGTVAKEREPIDNIS